MALFGLNWEESKWPGHFCPAVPTFFASKIGVKLPPEKKVPWHRRWAALGRGSNCHFCQKNAFFGQKKAFFQKVHFIQKCSVTQNTVFQCVKNNFLLAQKKLIFFTILNLDIWLYEAARRSLTKTINPTILIFHINTTLWRSKAGSSSQHNFSNVLNLPPVGWWLLNCEPGF